MDANGCGVERPRKTHSRHDNHPKKGPTCGVNSLLGRGLGVVKKPCP